jgi:hypothetical protein
MKKVDTVKVILFVALRSAAIIVNKIAIVALFFGPDGVATDEVALSFFLSISFLAGAA